jgi:superfamily II DNA/RNA helicase
MTRFKNGKINVLVCTDVAARGIDVKGLSHVFNHSLPNDIDSYTHRIGRTGRAGQEGKAYNFVTPGEQGMVRRIENVMRTKMNKIAIPTPAVLKTALVEREIEKMAPTIKQAQELKNDFNIDPSFESWKKSFDGTDKEDILKIFFARTFNRDFRLLDEVGDLNMRTPVASGVERRPHNSRDREFKRDFSRERRPFPARRSRPAY